jgi:hypothetical protein
VKSDLDIGPTYENSHVARVGTHVVITGTALCGAAVALKDGYYAYGWRINQFSNQNFPITPSNQTPTTIEFTVPSTVPVSLYNDAMSTMYVIVLTKNSQTVTAPDALAVFPTPPPRYIYRA